LALGGRIDCEHPHARLVGALELGERAEPGDVRDRAQEAPVGRGGDEDVGGLDAPGDVAQLRLVAGPGGEPVDR
jgi:hypothetical protein